MDVTPVHRADERGIAHTHPRFVSWYCSVHDRVCSPFTPITVEQLLTMAAKDETLDDGAFVRLRRAVSGDPSGPTD